MVDDLAPGQEQALTEALRRLSLSHLSDAMDRLGLWGACPGIKPVVAGHKIAGPAYTVHYVPVGSRSGSVGDYIDDVPPGAVVVLDNGGRTAHTVWGDLLSWYAAHRGVAGTVVDGCCRDIAGIQASGYPVFSKGVYFVTGRNRALMDAVEVTVSLAGTQVNPGDFIAADDNGVIVIPRQRAQEVVDTARAIEELESRLIEEALRGDTTLRATRARYGYHQVHDPAAKLSG